jgi:cyclohexa-1,5-dienecarbonyl-CoA hydratase
MSKVALRFEHRDELARMVLNSPKTNILDMAMLDDLMAALRDVRARPGVKLVVLEGAGAHFCYGASVEEHRAEQARDMIPRFGRMFEALMDAAIPTAAAVHGQCLGGGMELALFCNWVFADPTARFGQPEIKLGVFPPVAALQLPMLAGQAVADDICLTGRTYTGEQGLRQGWVHAVVEDVEAAVQEHFASHIAPLSAAALRHAVRASRRRFNEAFRAGWAALELQYLDELMITHDANEGIAAFLAKRQPVWAHR